MLFLNVKFLLNVMFMDFLHASNFHQLKLVVFLFLLM